MTLDNVGHICIDIKRPATKSTAETPKSMRLSLGPSIKPTIHYDRQQQLIDVLCSYVSSGPDG